MCLGGGYLRSGTRHSCATSSAAGGVGEVMWLVAMIWGGGEISGCHGHTFHKRITVASANITRLDILMYQKLRLCPIVTNDDQFTTGKYGKS